MFLELRQCHFQAATPIANNQKNQTFYLMVDIHTWYFSVTLSKWRKHLFNSLCVYKV